MLLGSHSLVASLQLQLLWVCKGRTLAYSQGSSLVT